MATSALCLPNLRGTFSGPAAACIHKHSLPLSNYTAHQNQCMLLYRRKKCEDDEKLILRSMSHAMVVLSRAWGAFHPPPHASTSGILTMKVGKYEKARICREKSWLVCRRIPAYSSSGPVLSVPHVHKYEERDRK